MSTVNKLLYLGETKSKIKDVANMTGAGIDNNTTFRNYAQALYDGYINVLKDRDTLLDNMPKLTSTGSISGAANLPIYEDKMSKLSTQETTTGKNKITFNNLSDISLLNIQTHYDNSTIKFNGTTNGSGQLIPISPLNIMLSAGTYTISYRIKSGTYNVGTAGNDIAFYLRNESSALLNQTLHFISTDGTPQSKNFILTEDTPIYFQAYCNASGIILNNLVLEIQIENGSTATLYEPYTGGIASPNPSYPQEVKTVKGYRNLLNWELPYNVQSAGNIILNNVPQIEIGKSYCFVGKCSDGTILSSANCSCVWYTGSTQILNKAPNNTFEGIDISNATGFYIYVTSAIVGKTISEFMLVEGTYNNIKNLPYVPYGTNWIYTTIRGKNLFDKDNATYKENYIKNDNGVETNTQGFGYTTSYIEVNSNTNYVLSGSLTNNSGTVRVYYYDYNKNWISRSAGFGINVNICPFTTPNNCKYIQFQYVRTAYDKETIQLEQGSTATTYEAYKEKIITLPLNNNEIAGIGDYKDEYIVDKNGHCWLNKKIGKVVLNDTEGWYLQSINSYGIANFYTSFVNNYPYEESMITSQLMNYFSKQNTIISQTQTEGFLPTYNAQTQVLGDYLRIKSSTASDVTELKTWLSTHNTEVYYILAEENLIDLNYNVDLTLFNGINNITNSEDMDMAIKYIKNVYE